MDQAANGSIAQSTIGQPAGGNELTIAALAARWAQLSESKASTSEHTLDAQTAIQDVILITEPRTRDETLTLAKVVADGLHAKGEEQMAEAMDAVCRGLQRYGAKSPLCHD